MKTTALLAALSMLGAAGALNQPIAFARPTSARVVHSWRRQADRTATKRGRAPVPMADERDVMDAAELKRERKAAKAARDIERSKEGHRHK